MEEITQVVLIANTAWHCGALGQPYNNSRSIGVEHEATAANPDMWNSIVMLNASATMARYFQNKIGFPTTQRSSPGICGHNDMPGTATQCPGTLPWTTWMSYFYSAGGTIYLLAPSLTSPPNAGVNQPVNPTFVWSSVNGATSYRILIATNPLALPTDPTASDFIGSGGVLNEITLSTTYIPTINLNGSTTYYWEVHARSPNYYGTWSNIWSFTTFSPCYTLATNSNPSGSGNITVNTAQNCSGGYTANTQISLTAQANPGYTFTDWSVSSGGSFSKTSSATTIFTITGNATITANFTQSQQQSPTVTTLATTNITQTSAQLNCTINPNGLSTVYYFMGGVQTGLISETPRQSAGSGTTNISGNYLLTGLSPNTTYNYSAAALNSAGTTIASSVSFTTLQAGAPAVTTTMATNITSSSATSGGTVSSDGGTTVTARGVCWSTSSNPTTSNSYTSDGTGTGSFTSNLTGLSSGTLYHYRAYATNSAGVSYGSDLTFTTSSSSPTITITMPTANTTWTIGNMETINWTSTGNVGNVNIKLSTDGGSTFPISLAQNTTNDGTETIDVPNYPSSTCRVKVESYTDQNIFGISTGNFFIQQQSTTNFWQAKSSPYNQIINSIAVNSKGTIFCAVGNHIYSSYDDGVTWSLLSLTSAYPVTSLFISSNDRIFAGTWGNEGIFLSTDNGNTWTEKNNGLSFSSISSIVKSGNGYLFVAAKGQGIYRSTDNGDNWLSTNSGLTNKNVNVLAVNKNGYIFAGTEGGGIFRSTDDGNSWVSINRGLNYSTSFISYYITSFAFNSNGDVFVADVEKIYRSTDNGNNWILVNPAMIQSGQVIYLVINSNDFIYAGSWGSGAFVSKNNGNSWLQINSGLTDLDISSLIINSNDYLYAGTKNGKIFKSISTKENVCYTLSTNTNISGGGTISVNTLQNCSGGYSANTQISLTAQPNSGYTFSGWGGSGGSFSNSTSATTTFTITGNANIVANFIVNPSVIITTNPTGRQIVIDGTTYTAPQTFTIWTAGSQHTISVSSPQSGTSGIQYVWSNWNDGGAISHTITIPSSATTYTANFTTQYYLTMNAGTGGTVTPNSGWYNASQNVPIDATPNNGYTFNNWSGTGSGSYTGTVKSTSVRMNEPISQTASFTPTISASLKPIIASAAIPKGTEFWVEVKVGDPNAVTDLYGISFRLTCDNNVCTYVDGSATNEDFLSSSVIPFSQRVDNQTVDIAVTKTSLPGVSGSGMVAKAKFTTSSNITTAQTAIFSLSNISATNSSGNTIPITSSTATVTIIATITVNIWPGDTNNDGIVSAADILPIGLYYGQTTSSANNPGSQWQAYARQPWTSDGGTPKRIYADANGDGTINAADILPIGLNYGKTHASNSIMPLIAKMNNIESTENTLANASLKLVGPSKVNSNTNFTIQLVVGDPVAVADLYGISFKIKSDKTLCNYIDNSASQGSFLGSNIISFFQKVDDQTVDAAITKTSAPGANGAGTIAMFDYKSIVDQTVTFSLSNVSATDSKGGSIPLDVSSVGVMVDVKMIADIPHDYALSQNYPNPFNPTTTIKFSIPASLNPSQGGTLVALKVYDLLGREVATLVNEEKAPGNYEVKFDPDKSGQAGTNLPSGVYFYRLSAGSYSETKKIILLK